MEAILAHIAFASCAKYQRRKTQPAWKSIDLAAPGLLLLLGDNVYATVRSGTIWISTNTIASNCLYKISGRP